MHAVPILLSIFGDAISLSCPLNETCGGRCARGTGDPYSESDSASQPGCGVRHSSAAPGPMFSITSRPWISSSACTPPATSGAPGGPHRSAQAGTLDALGSPLRGSWSAVIGVEAGGGGGGGGGCCASPRVPAVPMASFVPPSRCIAHASLGVPLSSGTPTDASWDPSRSAQAGTSDWIGSPLGGSWSGVGGPGGGGGGLHPSVCHGFQ